jgi:hypothetical protein
MAVARIYVLYTVAVILAVGMLPKIIIKFLIFFSLPCRSIYLLIYSFKIYQVISILLEIFTFGVILED